MPAYHPRRWVSPWTSLRRVRQVKPRRYQDPTAQTTSSGPIVSETCDTVVAESPPKYSTLDPGLLSFAPIPPTIPAPSFDQRGVAHAVLQLFLAFGCLCPVQLTDLIRWLVKQRVCLRAGPPPRGGDRCRRSASSRPATPRTHRLERYRGQHLL